MIRHDLPIFRSNDVLEDELSSQHITEHVGKSLTKSAYKLTELDFITEDFRRTTKIETTISIHS